MPRWLIEVIVIYVLIAISISQGQAAEDCDYLVIRAYECQFDWQQGKDCKNRPVTDLERQMLGEVNRYQQHVKTDRQQQAAITFARAWRIKCINLHK